MCSILFYQKSLPNLWQILMKNKFNSSSNSIQKICSSHLCSAFSVADPGFSRGGVPTLKGVPIYYLANFSRNKNEEILGRGARVPCAPLDPPMFYCAFLFNFDFLYLVNHHTTFENFFLLSFRPLIFVFGHFCLGHFCSTFIGSAFFPLL